MQKWSWVRVLCVLLLSEVFARLAGGKLVVGERGVCSSSDLFLSIGTDDACIGEEVGFLHGRDLYVRLTREDIVVVFVNLNATVTVTDSRYRVRHVLLSVTVTVLLYQLHKAS